MVLDVSLVFENVMIDTIPQNEMIYGENKEGKERVGSSVMKGRVSNTLRE